MKLYLKIFLLLLNLPFLSFGQKFLISEIPSEQFTIDKVGQEVYFKDFYSDTIRAVNLKNGYVSNTGRRGLLPFFGNKNHIMLYGNNSFFGDSSKNNIYLYELDEYTYQLITDTISFPYGANNLFSFSTNDSNFIFINNGYLSLLNKSINSFSDTLYFETNDNFSSPQWSSDTSFVYLSSSDNDILEYFLKSGKIDTLVSADPLKYYIFLSYAYNPEHNILAYSTPPPETSQVYFHYKDSNKDSLIFSPHRDDPDYFRCWDTGARGITSLCWSPDNKKLAFLGFQFIDISTAGIYVYLLDSNKTYKATDCDDYGLKYYMRWANNDTLIYANLTDGYLYGIDVSSIVTTVEQINNDLSLSDFSLANHPNPFNNNTIINVKLPNNTTATLSIYDAIGRLVKKYHLDNKEQIKYEITWDGLNDKNQNVSAGFYLGVIKLDGSVNNFKTIKMIYLK